MDISSTTMVGRLTRNPEIKKVRIGDDDKSVCEFSIAVNGYKEKDVSFFSVVTWGALAENCQKYLVKGKQVGVHGRMKQERWEKDGVKKDRIKLHADTVQFLGNKGDGENASD